MDVETLHSDILSALPSDLIAQVHLADPADSCWSTNEAGFLQLDGRIYIPDLDDLCLRVLRYRHDHPLAGHFGQNQTLELIWREYTWPGLRTFVKDYVQSCTSCTRAKTPRHRPYGLLKQLPIPEKPWNSISMDFIEQLPSSTGFTAILVVVDRLSKQAIFIPTHDTITSLELAKLFLLHVFSKHGVPTHVTSDHGTEFVSHFFWSLGKALDMHLHFTPPVTTRRAMARQSGLTRHWNSTSGSTATISRTTWWTYSHWQSSHTTTHQVLLLESHRSLLTRATTLTSLSTQNVT